jgi:hypothetical protein
MTEDPFAPQFLFFHAVNYGLAVVAYTMVGQTLLAFFAGGPRSEFFIMRFFRSITGPFIRAFGFLTPRFVRDVEILVPLYVAFWIFVLRFVIGLVMLNYGLAPRVGGAA